MQVWREFVAKLDKIHGKFTLYSCNPTLWHRSQSLLLTRARQN